MKISELISYAQNKNNIIIFPSFSSTFKNKQLALKFSSSKKKDYFSVLITIMYDCDYAQKPNCIDLEKLLERDENIFLPFSFFEIIDVKIDHNKNFAKIKLKAINREIILEKYMNKNNKIQYNQIKEIIEIKRVINLLIIDLDKTQKICEIYKMNQFLEDEIDGAFLVCNNINYFKLLLQQIKIQNNNKKKILITFQLLIFGDNETKNILNIILNEDYKKYFKSIIVISSNENLYKEEISKEIINKVLSRKQEVIKFLQSNDHYGSLLPFKVNELVTIKKYDKKYDTLHETISKYYKKISEDYSKTALDIFKDFIENNTKNNSEFLNQNILINTIKKFLNKKLNNIDRFCQIIKTYTDDENYFYQNFNYWLRNLDPLIYEKVGYFVSNLMLALNEYGRIMNKGIKTKCNLYRGLKMKISDLLLYLQFQEELLLLPSFTSTTIDQDAIKTFYELFDEEKEEGFFGVKMIIEYDCSENQIPTAIDISEISFYKEESERLILPFTFFKVGKININLEEQTAEIYLKNINREIILEKILNYDIILKFNKEKQIIEANKNKIVIYDITNINYPTKIFGEEFVEKNKDNLKLKIEGKILNLCSEYKFKTYGSNKIGIIQEKEITDMSHMFQNCTSIISIENFKKWDVKNVENMSHMFYNCTSLTSIEALKNWNVSKVTNMKLMFSNCISIFSIESLKNWNVSNVKNFNSMFKYCTSINSIEPLNNWNINRANDLSLMFSDCTSLYSINSLKYWDVSNVKNLEGFFHNCKSITNIDSIKNWNISNCENIKGMFSLCSINSIEKLKSWDFSKVKNMSELFSSCKYIKEIDIVKNWNINNVTDMSYLFCNCKSLKNLDGLKFWDVIKVKNMEHMFDSCISLNSIEALKNWTIINVNDISSMFEGCTSLKSIDALKNWNIIEVNNVSRLFRNCILIKSIDAIKNWNFSHVKDMSGLFENCISISSIKAVEKWNVSNVEDMSNLFYGCENINSIEELKNWKVKKVINMKKLFDGCKKIKSIFPIGKWEVSKVNNMFGMFYECKNIETFLPIKNWKIKNVKTMDKIFDNTNKYCFGDEINKDCFPYSFFNLYNKLKKCDKNEKNRIKLKNNKAKNPTNKKILYDVDTNKWKIKIFGDKFVEINKDKIKLKIENKIIDLSVDFQFSKIGENEIEIIEEKTIVSMCDMFYGCDSISSLDSLKNWSVKKVENMSGMFNSCNIISLDPLRDWDVRRVTNMSYMFYNCFSIQSLEPLNKWKLEKLEDKKEIFGKISSDILETMPEQFK